MTNLSAQYAVVGNPIEHSKSPQIHTAFAEQCGQDMRYSKLCGSLDNFEHEVREFLQNDGKGMNVTVPFKERAFAMTDVLTDRARLAGAVNTLYVDAAGKLIGDTTDGLGLVRDLTENNGLSLSGKSVLVLGAGGAVRGILEPLLACSPSRLVVCNRTLAKVDILVEAFADLGKIEKAAFEEVQGSFDLIINGTSASLSGSLPPIPETVIGETTVCYDMMYGAEETVFCAWARQLGASQCLDGLGMLVEQAAVAFQIWRGVEPETRTVIDSIRSSL